MNWKVCSLVSARKLQSPSSSLSSLASALVQIILIVSQKIMKVKPQSKRKTQASPPPILLHHIFLYQLQTSITQSFLKLEHLLWPICTYFWIQSLIFGSAPKRVLNNYSLTFFTKVEGLIISAKSKFKNWKFGMVVKWPKSILKIHIIFFWTKKKVSFQMSIDFPWKYSNKLCLLGRSLK